jgi:hypothetical protein
MIRVGKNAAAAVSTAVCIALFLGAIMPLTVALAVDTTPPVTNASLSGTPGNNGWYVSNVTVALLAVDNGSGINRTMYDLDGAGYQVYNGSMVISDGVHTVKFYSIDNASNQELEKNVTVKVDRSPPGMSYRLEGQRCSKGWFQTDVKVTLFYVDGISGNYNNCTRYSLDGTHWINYTGPFTVPIRKSGPIYYNGTDLSGNSFIGDIFLYFPPAHIDMTGMLGGVVYAGDHVSPTPAATPVPTVTPTVTPTPTATPFPSFLPSPSALAASGTLVAAALVAVLALIGAAGAALYLFLLKPK